MKRSPHFLKKYFWDINFGNLDVNKHEVYVLKRILEYGDEKAIRWMDKTFERKQIINALSNFRGFSLKSANFWAVILNIKKENVKCLKKSFQETQKQFWPY